MTTALLHINKHSTPVHPPAHPNAIPHSTHPTLHPGGASSWDATSGFLEPTYPEGLLLRRKPALQGQQFSQGWYASKPTAR
jgi:hypothetical protein